MDKPTGLITLVNDLTGITGTKVLLDYDLDEQVDTVLVFPNWGIVGFPNINYGGTNILNYEE